jgi:hypothetical protein
LGPSVSKVGTPPLLRILIAYRDSFFSFRSPTTQTDPKGVGVPVVKFQHKPHQHRDFFGHHHDHWERERENILFIVPVVGSGRPPWFVGIKDFLDTLVFWKTTQFHALAAGQPLALDCPGVVRVFWKTIIP